MKILPTQNKEWGFWGTSKDIVKTNKATQKVWDEAFTIIQEKAGFTPLETVALLDSRWGRHTADECYNELKGGTFATVFEKKMTKTDLYKAYNYYVDETAYKTRPNHKELFCKELAALSKKHCIVIKSIGGVIQHSTGFIWYDEDLDSGDLIPVWED